MQPVYKISLFIMLLFISTPVWSQQVNVVINIQPNLPPYLSELEINPSLTQIMLSSNNSMPINLLVLLEVKERTLGKVFSASSTPIQSQPGPWQYSINSTQYMNWESLKYNPDLKNQMVQSGRLPEGEFELCTYVHINQNGSPGLLVGESCMEFSVQSFSPPQMTLPENFSNMNEPNPLFQWIYDGHRSGTNYTFSMVEVLPNQKATEAQAVNPKIFTESGIAQTQFIFSQAQFYLTPCRTYAAWIELGDKGTNYYENNPSSKSEPVTFRWQNEIEPEIVLSEPGGACVGNVTAATKETTITFTWVTTGIFQSYNVVTCANACGKFTPSETSSNTLAIPEKITYSGPQTGASINNHSSQQLTSNVSAAISNFGQGIGRSLWVSNSIIATPSSSPCTSVNNSVSENFDGILTPGSAFTWYVIGTLADGSTVSSPPYCYRYSPTTTTGDVPVNTPCDCNCIIDHTLVGGKAIKVLKPLAANVFSDANKGMAIGLSALAEDKDMIIQSCILEGTFQKLIEDVGDPVVYEWSLEGAPKGWILLAGDASGALLVLPPHLKIDTKEEGIVKLKISSTLDESIEGMVKIKLTGSDTCLQFVVSTDITPLKAKEDKIPTIVTSGKCIPNTETWDKAAPIAAKIESSNKNIQIGQVGYFKVLVEDNDKLTLKCSSDKCGNPTKEVPIKEGFICIWDDGGAGGTFVPDATGSGIFYIAPDKSGVVKLTCKVTDKGNHRDASGEKTEATLTINVVDALTEINNENKPEGGLKKYFTVGSECGLKPVWTAAPIIEVLKIVWCLDLGSASGKIEAMLEDGKGMKPEDAALKFFPALAKDDGLKISWQQHHHIHGKYKLFCRITYRYKGEEILYTDEKIVKSNFLEGPDLNEYKLFFNARNANKDRRDDGKWRENTDNDDDYYATPIVLNGTNPQEFLTHWVDNTYKPCSSIDEFGIDLKDEDPSFVFVNSLSTGPDAGHPWAEYRWINENKVYITPRASDKADMKGLPEKKFTFINSKCKVVTKTISLPAWKTEGLETFIKTIGHELSHYLAVTKYWRGHELWGEKYGPHTSFVPWSDFLAKPISSLKDVKTYPTTHQTITTSEKTKLKLISKMVNEKDDKADKYELHLLFTTPIKGSRFIDSLEVAISRGWFVDGKLNEKGDDISSGTIFYSEDKAAVTKFRLVKHEDKKPAMVTEIKTHNGIVIERLGLVYTFYERHNDVDGDWIPNAEEDEIGMDWIKPLSHPGSYHGKPNDQEFFAEWLSCKELIDPATKRLKDKICDEEKDWANPGLQTEVKKK